MIDDKSIDKLNDLLRHEISATEIYQQAIFKLDNLELKAELEKNQISHAERAQELRMRVLRLGGKPVVGSGVKGKIMSISENIASTMSVKAAISVLEEEEDQALKDYQKDLHRLDDQSRTLVMQLLPEQERTHSRMSMLKKRLEAA